VKAWVRKDEHLDEGRTVTVEVAVDT
jgi:hypothetical protein